MNFPIREPNDLIRIQPTGIPTDVLADATEIVGQVRERGEEALSEYVSQFQERIDNGKLFLSKEELQVQLDSLEQQERKRLERIASQIRDFAIAQRAALSPATVRVPGGTAGHTVEPMERAGCYAPGGRYPLPSSVLMTAVTARVAGVESVWVASPKPAPITMAAAAVAEVDGMLTAGGAHAIAALAFGVGPIPPSDIVVGPGNEYVTAAKQILMDEVAIDMLAGPSELVIVADSMANPTLVAADLLAQAEHDTRAVPILLTLDVSFASEVQAEIERQLKDLPTGYVAKESLKNGGIAVCESWRELARICNTLAPEHLQLSVEKTNELLPRFKHFGAVFIGESAAEVFGDYGAGPNHVLPTVRSSRVTGGLSVFDFLRIRTWLRSDGSSNLRDLVEDSAWLARKEGLEAHARAAEARLSN